MSYKITIEQREEYESTNREWKHLADTGNERDGGPVYGYVTYVGTSTRTVTLLEQTVHELDVIAVIKAVNGIK